MLRFPRACFEQDAGDTGSGSGSGGTGETTATTTTETKGEGEGSDDLAGLKRALDAERTARRTLERQNRDLARFKTEREQAEMTDAQKRDAEVQRITAERDALAQQIRDLTLQTAIAAAATKAGALYPDTLYRLVDTETIERDADGKPTNLTAVLRELRQTYPALFRTNGGAGSGDVGGGNAATTGQSVNDWIRAARH